MTFHELAHQYLTGNGMFDSGADKLLAAIERDEADMRDIWRKQTSAFPTEFAAVFLLRLKRFALLWIEANEPEAWYRPMFAMLAGPGMRT